MNHKVTVFAGSFKLCCLLLLATLPYCLSAQINWKELYKVEKYQLYEIVVHHPNAPANPVRDVELLIELTHQDGNSYQHFGFWDGDSTWRIRFSPFENGIWTYNAWFSDSSVTMSGAFGCIDNVRPGKIVQNKYNPFWLGKGDNPKDLFRSLHVGDRFFATNWDDPFNDNDGNLRSEFLDWASEMGYNMLSVASFFTNRDVENRGQGWHTPKPWPIDPAEYRKIETIMDDLLEREINVYPFAGLFGLGGDWPTDWENQQLYIKYLLARLGHYPNLTVNIAGPEPTWRKENNAYQGAMRLNDINRIGSFIDSVDVHNLILTVHNEKRATQFGDPFVDEPWYSLSTLQGPTTQCRETLFSGLTMNHHRYKPAFAQETLWSGNVYHPDYSDDQLRKNAFTVLFSGSIINFADNDGLSSSGFSGTCDLNHVNPAKHKIIRHVWDWFETIPFHTMVTRQDLVKQGFCLANEGVEYYIYLDTIGEVNFFADFDYPLYSAWINAVDPSDIRPGETIVPFAGFVNLQSPSDGDDWILHVSAQKPQVIAQGNFPDIATDRFGNIHVVYNRNGLKYRKYDHKSRTWLDEQDTGCGCEHVERSDPDIVTDSKGNPHVFCGRDYAFWDGKKWNKSRPGGTRDTELAIDSKDNVYLTSRGGNQQGYIGLVRKTPNGGWEILTDPDNDNPGSNNHHYADMFIDQNDIIHIANRNGAVLRNVYRRSDDGGTTWPIDEPMSNRWDEAPHIVVDTKGIVYITTGYGELFERSTAGNWRELGRMVNATSRMRPELGIDKENNIYISAFGGRLNMRHKNVWSGQKLIEPVTSHEKIGFVETAGYKDFVYIVWEEGDGDPDEGLKDDASIVVGKLYPDGRLIGME